MKKNTTTILLLAGAAAAAYFYFKNKGKADTSVTSEATEQETKPGDEESEKGAEKVDAVVTAPKGQFNDAVEKAVEIAQTIKDAAVVVKSGDKTAVVKTGYKKKKKVKRPKLTNAQIEKACKGLTGRKRRQCIAKAKKAATITPKIIPTANPYLPFQFTAVTDTNHL
jgi:hypothetical protein